MKLFTTRCLIFVLLACAKLSTQAQTFSGTNAPGSFQDFSFTVGPGATNLSVAVSGGTNNYSHLLLKRSVAPTDTSYDFIALANGQSNSIHLEDPEFMVTNYVVRVRTPTNSLTHGFTLTISTNATDMRTPARPATKALVTVVDGVITSNSWQYFRVDVPTNLPGWRLVLHSTNAVSPDLYILTNQVPVTTNYWKRSTSLNPDTLFFTNNEATPNPCYVGLFLGGTTNVVRYTLTLEIAPIINLTWDPGTTHKGTQVYTNHNPTGGDYFFRIVAQNTAVGAWRTALNVESGEAQVYLQKGVLPTPSSATYKSERVGSDGFVVPSSAFKEGEEWYMMVRAQPSAHWNLVTGEPFVLDLGTLATDDSSGSGEVGVGAEGMRFFKTMLPLDTPAWRLWLNGLTNLLLVKKVGVPVPGATDLTQSGQMLVVPSYLVPGQLYFVGVSGAPGLTLNLDSRQHTVTDINFQSTTSLSVTGYPYASYRVQVPVDQLAWQISVAVSNGNPNVAVRRSFVPNELNNDAYSEVAGLITDSISLVPPTLSDGTFYITVYSTNAHTFTLSSGPPEVTDINFTSSTTNNDPNRAGWRYFRVTDLNQQLGVLGWDLFLQNFAPGTRIAIRRNAVPSLWSSRNNGAITSSGFYNVLSGGSFLQNPAHQADVWYVGVYSPNTALGAFTLVTQPLTAEPMGFDNDARTLSSVPSGKWQFFQFVVPTNTLGWDLRFSQVLNGSPRIVIRRDQLPTAWTNLTSANGTWTPANSFAFPSGYQWKADNDWTRRPLSSDGFSEVGQVIAMGMGQPLEPGVYYVGVIDVGGTNTMSYTLMSRGMGPGFPIPVTDLAYAGGSVGATLPAREAAYYRVQIPTNMPSWKVRLAANSGDVMLLVLTNRIPNVDSGRGTFGKTMQKIDNEHYVLLPTPGRTTLVGGTYYLAVVAEGEGPTGTRIGTGSSSYTLTSEGPLPVLDLGTLTGGGPDITRLDTLEGGEVKAYTFSTATNALAMEIRLNDRVGNPVMVATFDDELPDPGQQSDVVTADPYGNEGGTGGAAAPDLITCANCEASFFSLVVKARGTGIVYSNASYTLNIHSVPVEPLAFDGGEAPVPVQTWGTFRYWEVTVPPGALGWDVRMKDAAGSGTPRMIIARGFLPAQRITFFNGQPGNATNWANGTQWAMTQDWTRRVSSAAGVNEEGRLVAMGMGRPLVPATYIIGIQNDTTLSSADTTYTLLSRGIGPGFTIPVVDLDFNNGLHNHPGLAPREAAYYRVEVPDAAPSWRVKVATPAGGDVMLLVLSNSIPNVDTGRPQIVGKFMQKGGDEHYVFFPTNGQTALIGGTYYLAVVSEGTNIPSSTRVGTGHQPFSIQSLGPLPIVELGTVNISSNITYAVTNQDGGSVRGFHFSVPPGLSSLEVRLDNRVGNPVMVARQGAEMPDPGVSGASIQADTYGHEGGYQVLPTMTNAGVGVTLVTLANPTPGTYSVVVKGRGVSGVYSNVNYTLRLSALSYTDLAFDCGTAPVSNHLAGTWRYFKVEVPTNALGWDIRLVNVSNGSPRMVVRRDLLPSVLGNVGWAVPGMNTNWNIGNQWGANNDWTVRAGSSSGANEQYRILAMGMGQPLEPGTYYVGINNSGSTSNLAYTVLSRGIGDGLCLPVTTLAYNGGSATNTLLPREAAYYRIDIPSNAPSLKIRVASSGGELMMVTLNGKVPSVEAGRNGTPGRFMQKAGNEHYLLLPGAGQSLLVPGTFYLAVVGEGINPANSGQIGVGMTTYTIICEGAIPVYNLGTIGPIDLVRPDTLEGGESKAYQFFVPPGVALEARLENRIGLPAQELRSGLQLPYPGISGGGLGVDDYGNEGGQTSAIVSTNNITLSSPTNGNYVLIVKARIGNNVYPDANYTVRVRQVPIIDLNFSEEQNTNGLSNVTGGLLADNQRAYYRVIVPATNNGTRVIGWRLELSQSSGVSSLRVRQNLLPDDAVTGQMPFSLATAIISPPFLTNGTWYVEVRGSNSTAFTLVSRAVMPERPTWFMPAIGQPSTTPGLIAPSFGDTGLDTNGVALPGDQGIDLAQGSYHFYAVKVPPTNSGIMRVQLTAISGNPDVYIRTNNAPTISHRMDGQPGTLFDRSLASSVTEYGNFVPMTGRTEFELWPGDWYLAVRASANANARYRLRLAAGNVQDLAYNGGSAMNQVVAGNDWRYYRVQFPQNSPTNWWITFYQEAGDVVLYLRDTVPPGNGTTIAEIRDWSIDNKNVGPYTNFNAPGTYLISTPQLRPGSVYYLGFKANNDAIFSVSNNVVGGEFPDYPTIDFYGGSVSNQLPGNSMVTYRIYAPRDATRWKHSATHISSVSLYLENGYLPTRTSGDDWRSTSFNSTLNQSLLGTWPWQPNANYYLTITNTLPSPQNYSFVMDGRNAITDDNDLDGMPDAWERLYFAGSTSPTAAGDYDVDGVSNLNEYLEGTNPADPTSVNPRLTVLATNGTVNVNPLASNYVYGAAVTLTALPAPGYVFVGWSSNATGTNNPLFLTLTGSRTVMANFRAPGDDFAQRIPITGWSNTVSGGNTNATKEPAEPNHAGNGGGRSVWWSWTPISSGNVTLTTAGSSFNTLLAVYTGNSISNLVPIAANDNSGTNITSSITFEAIPGVAYAIVVDGFGGALGDIQLQVRQENAPVILGSASRLGDGTFQFTIEAEPGYDYHIQASSNLVQWQTIATLPNPTGLMQFNDPNASLHARRFYRAFRGVSSSQLLMSAPLLQQAAFSFAIEGPAGQVVRIETGTDLSNWATLATLTNTTGTLQFADPAASNYLRRFYRAVSP